MDDHHQEEEPQVTPSKKGFEDRGALWELRLEAGAGLVLLFGDDGLGELEALVEQRLCVRLHLQVAQGLFLFEEGGQHRFDLLFFLSAPGSPGIPEANPEQALLEPRELLGFVQEERRFWKKKEGQRKQEGRGGAAPNVQRKVIVPHGHQVHADARADAERKPHGNVELAHAPPENLVGVDERVREEPVDTWVRPAANPVQRL